MHPSSSLILWSTWVRTFKAISLHTQVKSLVLNQIFIIFKIRVSKIETLISQQRLPVFIAKPDWGLELDYGSNNRLIAWELMIFYS